MGWIPSAGQVGDGGICNCKKPVIDHRPRDELPLSFLVEFHVLFLHAFAAPAPPTVCQFWHSSSLLSQAASYSIRMSMNTSRWSHRLLYSFRCGNVLPASSYVGQ